MRFNVIFKKLRLIDGNTQNPIADPLEALLAGLLGVDREPSIQLYVGQNNVGAVNATLISGPEHASGGNNYWPQPYSEARGNEVWNTTKPRFKNLRDAAVASLKMGPEEGIYLLVHGRDRTGYALKMRFDPIFTDTDFVPEGSVRTWWLKYVEDLRLHTRPVEWLGSDDPLL